MWMALSCSGSGSDAIFYKIVPYGFLWMCLEKWYGDESEGF